VDLAELVQAIRVVELTAKRRPAAYRALVKAGNWAAKGVSQDDILTEIEERETAAQTLVAPDLALPHATVDWDGQWQIVLGRSRQGVDFETPAGTQVQLILLVIEGRQQHTHVELLAALAELLESVEFRHQLIAARDTRSIERLLRAHAGIVEERPRRRPAVPRLNGVLVQQAIALVEDIAAQALLLAVDDPDAVPWLVLDDWQGRVLVVSSERREGFQVDRPNTHLLEIGHSGLSRMDRANLGLLLAASTGRLNARSSVVCVTGPTGGSLDSITVAKPEAHLQAMFPDKPTSGTAVRPPVILRVLSLAIELAAEGREAHPVGTVFVIGDTRQVLRHTKQLVLNPFHGFSHNLRNVLDPSLAETIKEFATVDGAFIVQANGTVLSAGTYLAPKSVPANLPSGLGARHQAAAAITAHTRALAIAVSQSTGTVTVFRNGTIVFALELASLTRW